jgi:hypothetical protein
VIIDGEARSLFKEFQNAFGLIDCLRRALKEEEGVVRVLKNSTRCIGDEGMLDSIGELRVMK